MNRRESMLNSRLPIRCGALLLAASLSFAAGAAIAQVLPVTQGTSYIGAKWNVTPIFVDYKKIGMPALPDKVEVQLRSKNISGLPLSSAKSDLRLTLIGKSAYQASSVEVNKFGIVNPDQDVIVTATFLIPKGHIGSIHSISINDVNRPKAISPGAAPDGGSIPLPRMP
ncbi:hypothetical protein IC614_03230 [Allosphingosinicella flava]|uniref:Uncharacterized protein n=1 Tax=Allosphingosinicella flava TaxID=2771430 RepID=A0A7T2GKN7_9SPHN|nr:hypothetical protein [Sphingosinicella flava]QPQ55626.1 hypothetical protein IC614_03230 [Sphingosinicella flava]